MGNKKTHYTSGPMGKGHEGFDATLKKIQGGDPKLLKGTSGLHPHLKVMRKKDPVNNVNIA